MSAILLFLRGGGWKVVAGGLLALALVGGVWRFSHVRYQAGYDDASRKFGELMAEQANRAAAAVTEANAKALLAERTATARIDTISSNYEKDLSDANANHAAVVASLRSGASRLRVSVAPGTCRSDRKLPATTAAASGSDGAETADLRADVAAGLESLAHDADNVARQLAACQAVIRADREAINTPR